jgi:hypothetical protein
MENQNRIVLNWEITPKEQRTTNQKILILALYSLPIIFGIMTVAIAISDIKFSFKDYLQAIFYGIVIILGIILFSLIINKIFPYKDRAYSLDNQGITISKGKRKKPYLWSDFDCFYEYTSRYESPKFSNQYDISKEEIKSASERSKEIKGQIFNLKKKSSGLLSKFYKILVVVYSEPDNSKIVLEFLNKHLPEKIKTEKDNLGLIIYKFK